MSRKSRSGNRGSKEKRRTRGRRSGNATGAATPVSRFPIRDWWASYFDSHYLLEYAPIFDLARDRREVARLIELLELPAGSRVLDVPCGQGRHAQLLAEGLLPGRLKRWWWKAGDLAWNVVGAVGVLAAMVVFAFVAYALVAIVIDALRG